MGYQLVGALLGTAMIIGSGYFIAGPDRPRIAAGCLITSGVICIATIWIDYFMS